MISFDKNKVVVPAVLILGVFIGGVVVLRTQGIGAQILSEGKKIFVPVASDSEADPDNDGLKNWEEKIHKTDARNPDTDGDGYLDGEEVASGYDPTIPAPGDALAGTDANQPRPLPQNLTNYLAQILTQKISSGEIAPAEGDRPLADSDDPNMPVNQEIISEALYQVGQNAKQYFVLRAIPDNEIIIDSTTLSKDSRLRYIVALGSAMKYENASRLGIQEVAMMKQTVDTGDTGDIEIFINDYKETINALKAVKTPAELADLHKKQISIFELLLQIMESVKNFRSDPAKAMAAVEIYPQAIDMLQAWDEELATKLSGY